MVSFPSADPNSVSTNIMKRLCNSASDVLAFYHILMGLKPFWRTNRMVNGRPTEADPQPRSRLCHAYVYFLCCSVITLLENIMSWHVNSNNWLFDDLTDNEAKDLQEYVESMIDGHPYPRTNTIAIAFDNGALKNWIMATSPQPSVSPKHTINAFIQYALLSILKRQNRDISVGPDELLTCIRKICKNIAHSKDDPHFITNEARDLVIAFQKLDECMMKKSFPKDWDK